MNAEKRKLDTAEDILEYKMRYREQEAWRKLQDKTQVFNVRVSEIVKSRGSHSIDVGEIAAMLVSGLTDDPAKIEKARLLGELHDIGHIPFGHAGESVADSIIKARYQKFTEEEKKSISVIRTELFGTGYAEKEKNQKPCFEHNENSVLQYRIISEKLGYEVDPEIVEGILSHSTSRYPELPTTLVQQAVRLADKIAYINYDTEDLRISFEGKEEWEALKKIYSRPILDAEGNAITITYNGKTYSNVLEFLEDLDVAERLNIFIEEAIRIAQEDAMNKEGSIYQNHETVLTGCNDIVVTMSGLKANPLYYDQTTKSWTPEGIAEKKRLKQKLIEKSPILYLSYEMKERSDEFIRAGVGLTDKTKQERAERAQSAVGNDDLQNQYIYNKLVTFIENRHKIELDKLPPKLKSIFTDLFQRYEEFKHIQEELINKLPGNTEHYQYPEIYTILNFIGSHSNTELMTLAQSLSLDKMFENEVLPQLQAIIANEKYYDKKKYKFTKEGLSERDKIVEKYGAYIKFRYGMDEFDFTPTTSQYTEEEARQYGHREEGYISPSKTQEKTETVSQTEIIDKLKNADKTIESAVIEQAQEYIYSQKTGVTHGR